MRKALVTLAAPVGAALRALAVALPGLIAVGLVSYGAWLAWPPAGFIAAGVLLLADRAWEQMRADRRTK